MRDEDRRLPILTHQPCKFLAQAIGCHLVEGRERLIAQKNARIGGKSAGDRNALAHA
jgi:hypothetical protein